MLSVFSVEKFIKSINKSGNYTFVILCGLALVHCIFLALFLIQKIYAMAAITCLSMPLYALILWLQRRGYYSAAGALTFLEILAHQLAGYYFCGPEAGFDLLLLSVLFAQFSLLPRTRCRIVATSLVSIAVFASYYLPLRGFSAQHSPLFYTDAHYAAAHEFTYPVNLFALIIYMLIYGAVANLSAAGRIEDLINTMHKDFLTGLFNRRYLEEHAAAQFCKGENLLVCMADVDNFKRINDTFGHANGDLVLKYIAMLIQQSANSAKARGIDCCGGRWGGEEFLIIASCPSEEAAQKMLEHLRSELEAHEFYKIGKTSATFGAVWVQNPSKSQFAEYVQAADEALYEGKRGSKNVVIFKRFAELSGGAIEGA